MERLLVWASCQVVRVSPVCTYSRESLPSLLAPDVFNGVPERWYCGVGLVHLAHNELFRPLNMSR